MHTINFGSTAYTAFSPDAPDPDLGQFSTQEKGLLADAFTTFGITQIAHALQKLHVPKYQTKTSLGQRVPSTNAALNHSVRLNHTAEDFIVPLYQDVVYQKGMSATIQAFKREGLIRRIPGMFTFGMFRLSDREETHIENVNGRARTERLIGDQHGKTKDRVLAKRTLWQRNTSGRYRERINVYYTRTMQTVRRRLVDNTESLIALQHTEAPGEICRLAKASLGISIPKKLEREADREYRIAVAAREKTEMERSSVIQKQRALKAKLAKTSDETEIAEIKQKTEEVDRRIKATNQHIVSQDEAKLRAITPLRDHIVSKLPYGEKLSEIASQATREFRDQTQYAENNVAWFDLKGHGVGEHAASGATTVQPHVRCEALPGGNGAYKLTQHAPGNMGKVNKHELEVRHKDGITTFTLTVSKGGEKPSEPQLFTVPEGGNLPAELYRHIDESVLDALYSEGRFKSFGELFGSQRAMMYLNRKVFQLTTEPMVATLRAECNARNINTLRGTGYSPNLAHYGENFHNTARAEFMSAAFQMMEKGELYLDGYCGFIQNLVDSYGGCIWAYQDAKTGKVYRYNPHGNDAFAVEEKTTFADIDDHTASAGMYEQPIGTIDRPTTLHQTTTDEGAPLDLVSPAGARLPPTIKVKTELDRFGHTAIALGQDGAVLFEESTTKPVWRTRALKPLGIQLPATLPSPDAIASADDSDDLHTFMIRDGAGKPIMAPQGMRLAACTLKGGAEKKLPKPPETFQTEQEANAFKAAMQEFAADMQAGRITQLTFECEQDDPLEHECAVKEQDGRLVALADQTSSRHVMNNGQPVCRTEQLVLNVSSMRDPQSPNESTAASSSAPAASPPAASAEALDTNSLLTHCSFDVERIERYVKVPIFIQSGDELLAMRKGDSTDPGKSPTRSLNRFLKDNYDLIEASRTEIKRLKQLIQDEPKTAKANRKKLKKLQQDIRSQAVYVRPMSDQSRPLVYGYQKVTGDSWDDLRQRITIASDCVHSQQGLNDAATIADPRISLVGRSTSAEQVKSIPTGNIEDPTMGAEFVTVASRQHGAYDRHIGPNKDREKQILQNAEFERGQGLVGRFSQYHGDMIANDGGFELDEDGLPLLELDDNGEPKQENGGFVYRELSPYLPEAIQQPHIHKMFEGDRAGNREAIYSGQVLRQQRAVIESLKTMKKYDDDDPQVSDSKPEVAQRHPESELNPKQAELQQKLETRELENRRAIFANTGVRKVAKDGIRKRREPVDPESEEGIKLKIEQQIDAVRYAIKTQPVRKVGTHPTDAELNRIKKLKEQEALFNEGAEKLKARRAQIEKLSLRTKPSPSEPAPARQVAKAKPAAQQVQPADSDDVTTSQASISKFDRQMTDSELSSASTASANMQQPTSRGIFHNWKPKRGLTTQGVRSVVTASAASPTTVVGKSTAPVSAQERDFRSIPKSRKLKLGLATQGAVGVPGVLTAAAASTASATAVGASMGGATGALLVLIAAQQVIDASLEIDRNAQIAGELHDAGEKILAMLDLFPDLLSSETSSNRKPALVTHKSKRSIEKGEHRARVPAQISLRRLSMPNLLATRNSGSMQNEITFEEALKEHNNPNRLLPQSEKQVTRALNQQEITLTDALKIREQLNTALAHLRLVKNTRNDQQFTRAQASGYGVAGVLDTANSVAIPVLGPTATAVAGMSTAGIGALTLLGAANTVKQVREWRRTKRISPTVLQRFEDGRGVDSSLRRAFKGWLADKRFFHQANAANWWGFTAATGAATGLQIAALAGVGVTGIGASVTLIGLPIGIALTAAAAFGLFGQWGARFTRSAESTRHLDRAFLGSSTNRQNKLHIMLANSEAYTQNGIGKMIEAMGLTASERVKWRRWAAYVVPSIANKRIARLIAKNPQKVQEHQLEMMKHLFQHERDYAAFKLAELKAEHLELDAVRRAMEKVIGDTNTDTPLHQYVAQQQAALDRAQHYAERLNVLNDKLHHGVEGIQMGVRDWDLGAWDQLRFEFLEVLGVLPDTLSRRELKERAVKNAAFYQVTEGQSKRWFRRFKPGVIATQTPAHRVDGPGMNDDGYENELRYFQGRKGGVDGLMAHAIAHTLPQKFAAERRMLMHTVFDQLLEETKQEKVQQQAVKKPGPIALAKARLKTALATDGSRNAASFIIRGGNQRYAS